MSTKADCAGDMMALVTCARTKGDEVLGLALDVLKIHDGESLRQNIVREAQLVSVMAGLSAALIEALDQLSPPGRVDAMLRELALKWATDDE